MPLGILLLLSTVFSVGMEPISIHKYILIYLFYCHNQNKSALLDITLFYYYMEYLILSDVMYVLLCNFINKNFIE